MDDQTFFTNWNTEGDGLILTIYQLDPVYTNDDEGVMTDFKNSMMRALDMTGLKSKILSCYLGITEIIWHFHLLKKVCH